ncbi:hypothetical protein CISG_06748 [Coccidioides immitis RMSCC 3703]|uniref:Uncharacterized protein n=2 Tax=Coccidioides immitis TaxID=5501 RepID=A0A0J8R0P7_COCIT|nr:hypothetical protein CIRG_05280 [Coccidioides immitis RMSCC 2394]KMU77905.1 hypothetical protein CISG_06748 [Coccidioides immitis RMSCC 3703]
MTIDSQVAGPLEASKRITRKLHDGRSERQSHQAVDLPDNFTLGFDKKVWMDGDLFASRSSPIVSWHAPIDQRVSVRRAWRTAKTQPPPQSLDFPIEWRKAEGIIILSDAWPPLSLTL